MIEAEHSPEVIREQEFERFMEQAVPDFLGISLDELRDTYEYRRRVEELDSGLRDFDENYREEKNIVYAPVVTPSYVRAGVDLGFKEVSLDEVFARIQGTMDRKAEHIALIEAFGVAVIDKIAANLPKELEEAARAWKGATESEQVDILRFVYDRCLATKWYGHEEGDEESEQYEKNELGQYLYTVDVAHPDELARWPDGQSPNCLGMSLLLAGFAHRAGAKYMFVNTIQPRLRTANDICTQAFDHAYELYEEMAIVPNEAWLEYYTRMLANIEKAEVSVQDFHHSVTVRIGEAWYHVDPYQLNFIDTTQASPFIDSIYADILRVRKKFPGRTLLDTQQHIIDMAEKDIAKQFLVASALARYANDVVLGYMDSNPDCSFIDFIAFFDRTNPAPVLVSEYGIEADHKTYWDAIYQWDPALMIRNSLSNIFIMVLLEQQDVDTRMSDAIAKMSIEELIENFPLGNFNEVFRYNSKIRQRLLNDIITFPVLMSFHVMNDISANLIDGTLEPDTTLEYGDPAFMVGTFALNHLRVWGGYGNKYVSTVLANQTSSQITWHEAMADTDPDISPTMLGIEEFLRTIPEGLRHARVNCRLFLRDNEGR